MRTPLVLATLLVTSPVLAQAVPARGTATVTRSPATTTQPAATTPAQPAATTPVVDERVRASREAGLAVREAIDSLRVGNLTNAMTALDRANTLEPGRADVPYYVGVTKRREQRYEDAIASFRSAIDLAGRTDDAFIGVRARVAVAETLERIDGRLPEARTAWIDVVDYIGSHPATQASPDVARERAAVIVARLESDQRYAEVRGRIAAREAAQQHGHRSGHHGGASH